MSNVRLLALALVAAGCGQTGPVECPSKLRPSARRDVAAAVVPATNEIYAYGGVTANGTASDELWRWSYGSCGGWLPLTLPGTPRPDSDGGAVFDATRHRIIIIGGNNDFSTLDTNSLTWTTTALVGGSLGRRVLTAFDQVGNRLVDVTFAARIISFVDKAEGETHFVNSPFPDKPPGGAALDPARAIMFKLDGGGMHGFHLLTETWSDVALSGDVPPAGTQLLWDDARQRVIALGDRLYTAALDGNGTTAAWTVVATTNAPPVRDGAALVVTGDTLWQFGGKDAGCLYDDLWQLDLNSDAWQNVQPATSCP